MIVYNIAVLLTCHNRKEKTKRAIESLLCSRDAYASKMHSIQLVFFLTDDGCIDGTIQMIQSTFPMEVFNIIQADERNRVVERKEVPLFDNKAFREAVINAIMHNQWTSGNEPMISVFSNRIEILSRGALPPAQTTEGFFLGESIPVNDKLSEIFLQLHISEKSGRGVPKII